MMFAPASEHDNLYFQETMFKSAVTAHRLFLKPGKPSLHMGRSSAGEEGALTNSKAEYVVS